MSLVNANRKYSVIVLFAFLIGCSLFRRQDKIPPIVEIIAPKDSLWFGSQLNITVFAYDSLGVESVSVYGDNNWLGTDTSEPYTFSWRLQDQLPFSWHSIYAKAYDKAENEGISQTLSVFYIGRQQISLYHGIKTIIPNNYFDIKFSAMIDDSLYGSTLVNNQDSLAHFFLFDDDNFKKFKKGESFIALLEFSNFNQLETNYHFPNAGDFYLVFLNSASVAKSVWLRFYLTRP